ncbi:MAG TPA: L,D-transpeptidase [Candidatus Polarisedimenticolia bacterium]|jgi:L,D-transpeptidase YbiS
MSEPAGPTGLPAADRSKRPLSVRIARALLLLVCSVILVSAGLLLLARPRGTGVPVVTAEKFMVPVDAGGVEGSVASLEKEVKKLSATNQKLRQRITALRPRGLYLVIDTGSNHLYVMQDETIVRDAVVSTGSGVRLADPNSDPNKPRSWVFDTPRGELRVIRKINDPVWTKPDWAFVEVGEDLPRDYGERIEEGVLGDYALDLGDGYLIHGTLFERALGLHVTHGCVRVGAKDLEAIFKQVGLGTRVYII